MENFRGQRLLGLSSSYERLESLVKSKRTPHALLILGEKGVGKRTFALHFAMALLCKEGLYPCFNCSSCRKASNFNHPDIIYAKGNEKTLKIGVDEIRRIRGETSKVPQEGNRKVFIIEDAENLTTEAHNYGPDGFEGVQARFNYRIYLNGRTEDELFMNLSQPCRRKTRIAMKNGVEIKVCGKEMLPDFHRIMEVTGKRDNFNIRPVSYFENFLDALGEYARLYIGFYNGEVVCGAIATNFAGKVCYVYGASDNNHREVMPNYLMQWEMIRWAVETNCDIYDFQGVSGNLSPENNPMFGLYQFKNSFNGQLDELVGELNFVYNKGAEKFMEFGIKANDLLKNAKRKLKGI